jgi:hypothetical protein
MAYDYASSKRLADLKADIAIELQEEELRLKQDYGKKDDDTQMVLMPSATDYN